jgi:opacity protein-like surface antigen
MPPVLSSLLLLTFLSIDAPRVKRCLSRRKTIDEEHVATRSGLILILTIFAVVPVGAQDRVEMGPLVGLYKAQNADGLRFILGAGLRYKFSEMLAVEASINYRDEKYVGGSVDVKSWPVIVTGLLYPIPFLYGAIGAGWYNTSASYSVAPGLPGGLTTVSAEPNRQFGWHFGGGVELPVFSSVNLVGDIRYVFLGYDFKSLPGSSVVNSNSPIITAGLLFRL